MKITTRRFWKEMEELVKIIFLISGFISIIFLLFKDYGKNKL